MKTGLLGRKLGHSYSPQIHSRLGSYDYSLFEKEPDELGAFLRSGDFTGLNVTIPYKKEVIQYCDTLSPCAKKRMAVNTIVRRSDGTLIGHNTDDFGFRSMLDRSGLNVVNKKVLVLGSGGASATASAVLEEIGAQVIVISRSGSNNYGNLHLHKDASVIVNATPVGMYPNTEDSPIDLDLFPILEGVLDLIYNPAHTKLLQGAECRGLVAQNGLWMLVAQAKESAEWFTNTRISDDVISPIHNQLSRQMENLILVGMPGCGKSTVGRILADRTGRVFVDSDMEIIKKTGVSIPEIFANKGEEGFRELESEVLAHLGKQSGLIIATGGGCVTKEKNYAPLHQNGKIIWLQRDLGRLALDGRPLSIPEKLEQMYATRRPLYERFSDIVVSNNGPAEKTVQAILSATGLEE